MLTGGKLPANVYWKLSLAERAARKTTANPNANCPEILRSVKNSIYAPRRTLVSGSFKRVRKNSPCRICGRATYCGLRQTKGLPSANKCRRPWSISQQWNLICGSFWRMMPPYSQEALMYTEIPIITFKNFGKSLPVSVLSELLSLWNLDVSACATARKRQNAQLSPVL